MRIRRYIIDLVSSSNPFTKKIHHSELQIRAETGPLARDIVKDVQQLRDTFVYFSDLKDVKFNKDTRIMYQVML